MTEDEMEEIAKRVTHHLLEALRPMIEKMAIVRESVAGRNALQPGQKSSIGRIEELVRAIYEAVVSKGKG